jgi:hypothetical protein
VAGSTSLLLYGSVQTSVAAGHTAFHVQVPRGELALASAEIDQKISAIRVLSWDIGCYSPQHAFPSATNVDDVIIAIGLCFRTLHADSPQAAWEDRVVPFLRDVAVPPNTNVTVVSFDTEVALLKAFDAYVQHSDADPCYIQEGPCYIQEGPCYIQEGPCYIQEGPWCKALAISRQALAISRKALAISGKALAISRKAPAISRKARVISTQAPAISRKALAISRKAPAISRKALAISRKARAISTKALAISKGWVKSLRLAEWLPTSELAGL